MGIDKTGFCGINGSKSINVRIFTDYKSGVIVKIYISLMDTFHKTKDLSLSQKIELLRDCKESCHTWWVDKLDCSVSLSRQQIDMDFEEIISKLNDNDSAHFVIIDREFLPFEAVKHFEIGFRIT